MNYDWLLPAILAFAAVIFLWRWRVCVEELADSRKAYDGLRDYANDHTAILTQEIYQKLDAANRANGQLKIENAKLRDFKAAKDAQRARDAQLKAEKRRTIAAKRAPKATRKS